MLAFMHFYLTFAMPNTSKVGVGVEFSDVRCAIMASAIYFYVRVHM